MLFWGKKLQFESPKVGSAPTPKRKITNVGANGINAGENTTETLSLPNDKVFSLWGHTDYPLLPRQAFILTIFLVDFDSARPIRARMHSRLVPISSSSFSFVLSIASVTRESTIPRLGEVDGGSESRRDRHSAGVLARLATVTAA